VKVVLGCKVTVLTCARRKVFAAAAAAAEAGMGRLAITEERDGAVLAGLK
jgi:hypothetical protein